MKEVIIELIDESAILPKRKHPTDAGFDLYSPMALKLPANEPFLIGLGFKMQLPSGYFAMITPRSGLALNYGITVLNSPGIIDENYRDEVGVILYFHNDNFSEQYIINQHERIAQMIILPLPEVMLIADKVNTESRGGGFGSTGK